MEYLDRDIDNYYEPILARESFDRNYQFYICHGDKNRELLINQYLDKVTHHLKVLIDKKKVTYQKIQLDVGINLKDLTDNMKKLTFYIKSKNVQVTPSNNTDDIIKKLIKSFFEKYHEQLLPCRGNSNYVFDSVEMLGIHFHMIDLVKDISHIESPRWLKNKDPTINPKILKIITALCTL